MSFLEILIFSKQLIVIGGRRKEDVWLVLLLNIMSLVPHLLNVVRLVQDSNILTNNYILYIFLVTKVQWIPHPVILHPLSDIVVNNKVQYWLSLNWSNWHWHSQEFPYLKLNRITSIRLSNHHQSSSFSTHISSIILAEGWPTLE